MIAKKIGAKNDLENYSYQMRNTIEDPKFQQQIKAPDRTKVEKAIKETLEWVDNSPNAELEEYQHKKKELEDLWKPIIVNLYGQGDSANAGGMPNMGNFGGASNTTPDGGPQIDEVD